MKWLKKIKNIFPKGRTAPGLGKHTRSAVDESDLYSLNRHQLKNLIDKNIHFGFFQVEDFAPLEGEAVRLLEKAQRKTEEELLPELENQDLQKPLVLVCREGGISKRLSQKLRRQGFVNVYFVEEGRQGLLKDGN